MFCQNCGTKAQEDAEFCPNCGAKLVSTPSTAPEPSFADSTQDAASVSNAPTTQAAGQPSAGQPTLSAAPYTQQTGVAQAVLPQKKKSKVLSIVLTIMGIVVVAFVILGIVGSMSDSGSQDNSYISLVKDGYPVSGDYNVSYGEAFDYFFSDPTWEYFLSTDDEDVVEFTGDCTYLDTPVTACIQFTLDTEASTFEITYVDFNGVPQTTAMWSALVNKAFSEAEAALS